MYNLICTLGSDETTASNFLKATSCIQNNLSKQFIQVDWFHNDEPIQIGSRLHTISDFGFVVLDIDWTFKRDAGVYTCRATNKYGSAESRATLACSTKKDINLDSQLPQGMSLDKLKDLEKVMSNINPN